MGVDGCVSPYLGLNVDWEVREARKVSRHVEEKVDWGKCRIRDFHERGRCEVYRLWCWPPKERGHRATKTRDISCSPLCSTLIISASSGFLGDMDKIRVTMTVVNLNLIAPSSRSASKRS